jgi:endo-beta-N-acetylglucosaminidase D
MKKRFFTFAAFALASVGVFADVSPTATAQVYDLDLFGDAIIDVFYTADKAGLKFPTQEMWEAAGYDMHTIEFVRSHVRAKEILSRADRLDKKTYEKRNLWMNIPIGIGKTTGGYPSTNVSDDTFTGWNYTNLFGSWNHGLFHAPGVVGDAGHKNGCDVMAGIKFFESWTTGSGASGWVAKVQETDPAGYAGYAYVRPLVNACIYFGKDGINYNFEDTGYSNCAAFHAACYKYAEECGMTNFHVGLYTSQSTLTASNVSSLLGTKGNQCYDTFLNYAASDFQSAQNIAKSVTAAEKAMGSCEDVYQGAWIVSMSRSWKNLSASEINKRMGIVLWGEHNQSRLMSWNTGNDPIHFQENYQMLQDRFFSGGYRNPAARPVEQSNASDWTKEKASETALRNFQGLAHYIPERTAIRQNLPFTTFFNIGNGERYNYKGKKTFGNWYNLGQQDIVPTYRWLVYEAGTTTAVRDRSYEENGKLVNTHNGVPYFTNADAYIGGSCLKLTNTQAVDIVLYRAELTVSGANPTATIALKRFDGVPEGTVSVIVKKKGETTWCETPFAQISGHTWEEQTVPLNGVATGDVIEYVGLRTSGNTEGMYVGELSLNDDSKVVPAELKDVAVEVVQESRQSLSVKLFWKVDQQPGDRAAWDMLYNDEANIDHFQIFYKDGEGGRVSEVARTTTWSAFVGNILLDASTRPFVGVRAASIDGKSYSKVLWMEVPRAEPSRLPESSIAADAYPQMILNEGSEGLENALKGRYITEFRVSGSHADFTYTNTVGNPYVTDETNKTNYILAENVIKVSQGQTIKVTLRYKEFSDGLQYCTARGYADWDGDCNFNATNDELVWTCGESNAKKANAALTNPCSFTIVVPDDARPGSGRLRLVFSDAWFPHPGPAGCNAKGCSLDFPMEISGTNAPRQAVDTHDTGVADDPLAGGGSGIVVQPASPDVSTVTYENGNLHFRNVQKAWIFTSDGKLAGFMQGNVTTFHAALLPHGTYLIRMQNGSVLRSTKVVL